MNDFFAAISHSFYRYVLAGSVLSSLSCGIIGSYITVKKISYIAGAISHSVMAGMGAAVFLYSRTGLDFFTPINGAFFSAILAAIIIGLVTIHGGQRMDTVLSAIWSLGMASGILFLYFSPGFQKNIVSFLFGNILMIDIADLYIIFILDFVIVLFVILFYNKIFAITFDEDFARTRGIRVGIFQFILLMFIAITIVALTRIVGIVMVIALLTLPSAIAGLFSKSLKKMMVISTLLNIFFIIAGLIISFSPDLPPGSVIIILAGITYFVALILKNIIVKLYRKTI